MMLARISNFVVGRDRGGRWTAMASNGLEGGYFVSRAAALRYARLETGREPGAVRQATSPIKLSLSHDRLGADGATTEGRGWLMLDVGIAIGFALLCLATGMILS